MSEKIKVLLSEEEVDARIRQIAAKISKDYAGKADPPDLYPEGRSIFYL